MLPLPHQYYYIEILSTPSRKMDLIDDILSFWKALDNGIVDENNQTRTTRSCTQVALTMTNSSNRAQPISIVFTKTNPFLLSQSKDGLHYFGRTLFCVLF